ncbi:ABC transporter ATP-binding protein [Halodesulfovibrio sp. MK-HDV]|jgi:peptide/nickel transport system ATP-binding protein|uniref:ABC transporter ATP-binding protein n=1 Tax=Halodesulfovibrio sp. MK-HDV TaxID=2599925 RepID=UPI00136E969E|nr:ABC transporter ATP-binding protein [Halodesulfovibrio sp. MK-HDV]KAF1077167.1 Oligopeptide transport ATP-binding protein OppD [Halodesulfovibrio sp. MK-HDV]
MAVLLKAQNLTTNFYTYEGVVRALDKFSLTIDHGCTYGLVGESGCGKSVTVRSMLRVIQSPGVIENGKVLFSEKSGAEPIDLLALSEEEMEGIRGDSISMIFQEPNAALNPVLTVGYQVAESYLFHRVAEMSKKICDEIDAGVSYGLLTQFYRKMLGIAAKHPKSGFLKLCSQIPLLKMWERPLKKEALLRAIDIVGKLGIANPEEIVTRYPHNLSGGMKQRIVIAIALACHPTLLIADEATSNLDVTVQAQILQLLNDLKKESISSILLITHDLGVVAETCEKVGVMYAGTLCETGDVKDVFSNPLHPYTEALLTSVPKFNQEGELQSIEGSVPNLVHPPSGCRFHPRCPNAMDKCSTVNPELKELIPGHLVACHYADQQIGGLL